MAETQATLASQAAPTVFLSYSHIDKRVARRLVRQLGAHCVKVWLDERELRVGAALTSSIRAQIEGADALLVIASQASADSNWVGQEIDFAKQHSKSVIPLFIEPLSRHERFRDYLGLDGTHPQEFADVIHSFMRDLFLSLGRDVPAADPEVLTAGLRELVKEEPNLAPLINGCLDSEGLQIENRDTVFKVAFHALDYAVNALFELRPNSNMAYHAASTFCEAGAGARALSSWISATGDGDLPLVAAVGTTLEPALIPTGIKLLTTCNPPNNHALYMFISRNSAQLEDAQRRSVIRLVTWPVRTDTSRLGDVLGWVASQHFRDAPEIQQMWTRWVNTGSFDSCPGTPGDLAGYLTDAHKEGLPGWEAINEALRTHVREFLRSADKSKVVIAMDHVQAAADAGAPVLAVLLREAEGVSGTAEWNTWKERDPEAAEWTGWYVFHVAQEAAGDRDWLRAWNEAGKMVEFQKERRRILAKD